MKYVNIKANPEIREVINDPGIFPNLSKVEIRNTNHKAINIFFAFIGIRFKLPNSNI